MRIAQVAPLFESVPPRLYGGTERVVHWLTEELVDLGHDVTLFASGDSVTRARLVPGAPRSLRLDKGCMDQMAHHFVMLEHAFREWRQFDLIHFHVDYIHYPLSRRYRVSQVTTLHGRLDIPDLVPLYQEFSEVPVVSISDAQRTPLPWLNWMGTVYHGFPRHLFSLNERQGQYLAFLGRVSPEKGLDRAIRIALHAGLEIKIAAKVDRADQEYFETVIRPLLSEPGVEFIGEIGQREKSDFLGNALALIFPINWPEPFGLVMIEAMACGTPTLAFPNGSVPEVISDGVTGIICNHVEQAAGCLARVAALSRRECRKVYEKRFTSERMASDYLRVYTRVIERNAQTPQRAVRRRHGRDLEEPRLVPDSGDLIPSA